MIQIQENISLQYFNTFGIDAKARYFIEVSTDEVLQELLHHPVFRNNNYLILGGGSNILFTKDFPNPALTSVSPEESSKQQLGASMQQVKQEAEGLQVSLKGVRCNLVE